MSTNKVPDLRTQWRNAGGPAERAAVVVGAILGFLLVGLFGGLVVYVLLGIMHWGWWLLLIAFVAFPVLLATSDITPEAPPQPADAAMTDRGREDYYHLLAWEAWEEDTWE